MLKSSSKKRFKKHIPILKSKEIVNTVTNIAIQFKNYYFFGPICTNKKFYKKLIFKKLRVSCHNLFLLGKRKPTRYLTLQEDHNVSINGLFLFCANGPTYGNQLQGLLSKVKISSLFLPKFN